MSMLAINLKPGIKRKRAGKPLGAQIQERLRQVAATVKEPLLVAAVVAWIAVIGFLGYSWNTARNSLAALEPQLERARAEHKRFQNFLQQKAKQTAIRDSLVKQIATIRLVDGDRYIWAHLLDEVTRALPEYTWINDLSGKSAPDPAALAVPVKKGEKAPPIDSTNVPRIVNFTINGRTVDIQAYTKFLRQLEASPWITNVTPQTATTVVEADRAVTQFVISGRFKQADSAYMQTVPLTQSVH